MKTKNSTFITFFLGGEIAGEFDYDVLIPNLHVGGKIVCEDTHGGTISKIETNICMEDGILYICQYVEANI